MGMSRLDRLLDRFGLTRKAIIPEYHMQPESRPRIPEWNLNKLYDVVSRSYVLQEIFRAIIQEVKRAGHKMVPKFVLKCEECGAAHQITVTQCEVCGSKQLRKPNPRGRLRAELLFQKPNSDRETFGDILSSIIYHDLTADDWYLSIEYAEAKLNGDEIIVPAEIKVRSPIHLRPIIDEFGKLGNSKEWFCPIHWNYKENPDPFDKPGNCPVCGLELQETAYIQQVQNDITGRWGINQMVHGSTYRVLPEVFGSPRAKSLWNIIHVLFSMDEWFFDTFSEGRLQYIVHFPGVSQVKLTELMRSVQAELAKLKILDERTGELRTRKSLKVLYLGGDTSEGISVHNVSIDPSKIGALDYYKMCIQACASVYGVQAIFLGWIEKGRTGTTPAMQIEVFARTIEEIQRDKEEILNTQLFPIFGIHDWEFKFNPLEKRDKSREADIRHRDAETALTLRRAGYDVWWDEYGEMRWSDHPVRDISGERGEGDAPPKKKPSGASGQEINETTTEREPHGPRPATEQDEEREK
jgi:ribosomal protein L40E